MDVRFPSSSPASRFINASSILGFALWIATSLLTAAYGAFSSPCSATHAVLAWLCVRPPKLSRPTCSLFRPLWILGSHIRAMYSLARSSLGALLPRSAARPTMDGETSSAYTTTE